MFRQQIDWRVYVHVSNRLHNRSFNVSEAKCCLTLQYVPYHSQVNGFCAMHHRQLYQSQQIYFTDTYIYFIKLRQPTILQEFKYFIN